MSYSTSNPPYVVAQGIGNSRKEWRYHDDDAATSVRVSGYFTDGYALGMRAGDTVVQVFANGSEHRYVVETATKSGGVDLSDGLVLGDGTNTD